MRNTIGLIVLVGAWFVTPVFGQEASFEDFQKFCSDLEGRWVGDVTWITDWPGLGKKGETVTGYFEAHMSEDGHLLVGKLFGGNGSESSFTYYDAASRTIHWTFIDSGGTVGRGRLERQGSDWVFLNNVSLKDGTKGELKGVGKITDGGKTWSWTHSGKIGDDVITNQTDVWRRVSN